MAKPRKTAGRPAPTEAVKVTHAGIGKKNEARNKGNYPSYANAA
jgi:hypothetical protein